MLIPICYITLSEQDQIMGTVLMSKVNEIRIRTHQLQAAAIQHQASCMLHSSLGLHVASSGTYVLPITLQ